jgi:dTDP-4-dehydrorhamnose 3,5-epimerase
MKLNLKKVKIPIKINSKRHLDNRGCFQEIFKKNLYGLNIKFTAFATSKKNVIRGLHFQLKNKQTKFLYVAEGKIAHVYECLSSKCSVFYHLENYRDVKNESGIKYNDETLKIKWFTKKPILSLRDQGHMSFLDFKKNYKSL